MASEGLTVELECPICFEIYDDPIALICGHSTCRRCIENLVSLNGKDNVDCPVCREPKILLHIPSLGHLRTNIVIRALADKHRDASACKCPNCFEEKPVSLCNHCKFMICARCKDDHCKDWCTDLKTVIKNSIEKQRTRSERLNSYIASVGKSADSFIEQFQDYVKASLVKTETNKTAADEAVVKLTTLLERMEDKDEAIQSYKKMNDVSLEFQKLLQEYEKNFFDEKLSFLFDKSTGAGTIRIFKGPNRRIILDKEIYLTLHPSYCYWGQLKTFNNDVYSMYTPLSKGETCVHVETLKTNENSTVEHFQTAYACPNFKFNGIGEFDFKQFCLTDELSNKLYLTKDFKQFSEFIIDPIVNLSCPVDLVVSNERIYVANHNTNEVIVINKSGKLLQRFGQSYFNNPTILCLRQDNKLCVINKNNIIISNADDGKFIKCLDIEAMGMACDSKNNLYICSRNDAKLKIFNSNFELVDQLNGKMDHLFRVGVLKDDSIVITGKLGDKVRIKVYK